MGVDHVDPLQLAIAFESPREMPGDEADHISGIARDEDDARLHRLPRMELASHICRDPLVPVILGAPARSTNARQRRHVALGRFTTVSVH